MIINQVVKGGGGSAPARYIEKTVDANGKLVNTSSVIDLTGVTDLGDNALYYAYYANTNITGIVDFSPLKEITGTNAMDYCFWGCTGITGADFSNVEKITKSVINCFNGCTNFASLNVSKLVCLEMNVSLGNFLRGSTQVKKLDFLSFKQTSGISAALSNFIRENTNVDIRFPAYQTFHTAALNGFLNGVTGCTVHFPSNKQSAVEALTGYSTTAPFGATSGTVLFDLPATVILTGANSVNYERSPKDDTATSLAWRVQDTGTAPNFVIDWTPFYTNGTTDPQVNDTIYSDSACTTTVTTISSIA